MRRWATSAVAGGAHAGLPPSRATSRPAGLAGTAGPADRQASGSDRFLPGGHEHRRRRLVVDRAAVSRPSATSRRIASSAMPAMAMRAIDFRRARADVAVDDLHVPGRMVAARVARLILQRRQESLLAHAADARRHAVDRRRGRSLSPNPPDVVGAAWRSSCSRPLPAAWPGGRACRPCAGLVRFVGRSPGSCTPCTTAAADRRPRPWLTTPHVTLIGGLAGARIHCSG